MSIYEYKVKDGKGAEISMEEFSGKVLLIVNTASKCGFTPQFDGLEKLYKKYKDKGLAVVGFPCNQFGAQDPGTDEEIQGFCRLNYGVTFPMMSKIDVNGDGEDPLYTYLKSQKKGLMGSKIKWNFTKFLVDREGNVVKRFAPTDKPEDLEKHILKLL
ncbi:glutathione peroxidase [Peptostreptococcaceae bacterium pGA-8]|nr:glutathione peroxidase [Peptostreptococcaceae bacterium pGA-8]